MIERTDEETGELVRAWLQRYGLAIVAGIALAIVAIGGYEWWQSKQRDEASEASAHLLALNEAVAADQLDEAKARYAEIADGALKPLADLLLATSYSKDGQADEAQRYFERAASSSDPLVAQTATWQLVQLYIAREDDTAAEQALQQLKGSAYEGQIALLSGVIAQKKGDKQAALNHFKAALQANPGQADFIQTQVAALEGELAVDTNKEQ